MKSANNPKNETTSTLAQGSGQIINKPWEVWKDYGTTDEERLGRFETMRQAMSWLRLDGKYYAHFENLDVIKRLPDGTLTTEY